MDGNKLLELCEEENNKCYGYLSVPDCSGG